MVRPLMRFLSGSFVSGRPKACYDVGSRCQDSPGRTRRLGRWCLRKVSLAAALWAPFKSTCYDAGSHGGLLHDDAVVRPLVRTLEG